MMNKNWINQIFQAGQANCGNIVRRNVYDVDKFAGFHNLLSEVRRRGYHMVRMGDQYVIYCNPMGSIDLIN